MPDKILSEIIEKANGIHPAMLKIEPPARSPSTYPRPEYLQCKKLYAVLEKRRKALHVDMHYLTSLTANFESRQFKIVRLCEKYISNNEGVS